MNRAVRLGIAAHRLAFLYLKIRAALGDDKSGGETTQSMGMSFRARIGAAAGLDRYGEFVHLAHRLGLGFVETGTVTPRAEPGANRGIEVLLGNLVRHGRNHGRCHVGISIAANATTPLERTGSDLCACMARGWVHADYFMLNLGSRIALLTREPMLFRKTLEIVRDRQRALTHQHNRCVPLLVKLQVSAAKIAESEMLINAIADVGLNGVLAAIPTAEEAHAGQLTRRIAELARDRLVVMSVGGIRSPQEACARIEAGASLVQLHRGLLRPGLAPRLAAINSAIITADTH